MEKKEADKKQGEAPKRPLYLYDLPPDVLNSLTPRPEAEGQEQLLPEQPTDSRDQNPANPAAEDLVGAQACSLCGLAFTSVEDQRGHLKSDLHHYNLKQKLRGRKPVSETEFEQLIKDLDESLSGSDSSSNDDDDYDGSETPRKDTTLSALLRKQATLATKNETDDADADESRPRGRRKGGNGKHPLLWFGSPTLPENTYYGIYRAVFSREELDAEDAILEAVRKRQLAPIAMPKPARDSVPSPSSYKGPHMFLCMIGGGHFAAMVVALAPRQTRQGQASSTGPLNREATVLAHKTFHRYTTRRKQGGAQSSNDNAKGAAHSAGSTLRRYNEQALVDDVRELLQDWKSLLDTAELLFVRATGQTNRRTLFGPYEGQVLHGNDPRIRGFPFSTRRATQNELMRSFIELTRLKVREISPATAAATTTDGTDATAAPPKAAPAPKLTEEEETALLHTSQVQALVRRSKLPALLSYLGTHSLSADFRFFPPDAQAHHHAPTVLHMAASHNSPALVGGLLVRGGADPGAVNGEGKTAFALAGDRATRDAFRVARSELGEAAWDWEAAGVPAALRREEVEAREGRERKEREAREAREAERRRAEEERLRAQEEPARPARSGRGRGRGAGLGAPKTAQERREEEARGLTAEQKARLERERRARAAEERIRRMQG